jgi:hypothetical protein
MGSELKKLSHRKKAKNKLYELYERSETVLIIHYSCESFYDRPNGKTPRITSIAVRNLSSGQTESFSIHKVAELKNLAFEDIPQNYDMLEKEMLYEYFLSIQSHKGHHWVHWNMRDINYGFQAIEHRYRILGGEPFKIEEANKFDLARALIAVYGIGYIGHPRIQRLIQKNKITDIGFLNGQQEAEAFDNGEYVKLHQSTLRKVDILANIFERTADNSISTNARWKDIYGVSPAIIGEILKEHWLFSLLGFFAIVLGIITGTGSFF